MKRRRVAAQKTPLKQTRISNFFVRGESSAAKRICGENNDSPDVILCTPPHRKTSAYARKSLESKLRSPTKGIAMEKDPDSAFFENSPPQDKPFQNDLKSCSETKAQNASQKSKQVLHESQSGNILNLLDDFGFDEFSSDAWCSENLNNVAPVFSLSFESCVKCIFIGSERKNHSMIFQVKECSGDKFGRVVLKDVWAFSIDELHKDDVVGVKAVKHGDDWVVDAHGGYVSFHPDFLVSSTAITGAMFCRRRGVLSNLFKGLDAENKIMIVGSILHEMFQKALESPSCTKQVLEKIMNDLLVAPSYLRSFYSCGMSMEDVTKELTPFIPHMIKFVKTYVTKELQLQGNNFPGTITDIIDIEESVSCLDIGFKGRIDVTVRVEVSGVSKIMPLELKTGRASFTAEHRNQVILYTIMMSHLGHCIDAGLLLYLREGILQEIKASWQEIRDMILLRNDFVRYIRHFSHSNLPDPIRMVRACKQCPYATVCAAYLKSDVSESHPIRTVAAPLDPSHHQYFLKWTQLVLLEDAQGRQDRLDLNLKGLVKESDWVQVGNEFKYSFKSGIQETDLTAGSLVCISSEAGGSRKYMGRIVQMTANSCSVVLGQEVVEDGTFTLEGYQSSLLSRYMTNLGYLIQEGNEGLRRIIIDREPSRFAPKIPKSILSQACLKILATLNENQQRAVLSVLACENYMLIEGPPGSGKTQTIAAMIRILLAQNQTVLLVSHTHSSVDNVLLRLIDLDFLRLGTLASIHPKLHSHSYAQRSQNAKSITEIAKLLSCNIVASTCLGLDADIVTKRRFDVCIVDESSQVLQPEVLKPLFAANKFVLLGDPKQLRPVVKNIQAQSEGMYESIFERLFKTESAITLSYQYRMNRVIMALVNSMTYDGVLKAGNEDVANACLGLCPKKTVPWLMQILSSELEHSIVFVDTSDYLTSNPGRKSSCTNSVEAKLIAKLVEKFLEHGLPADNIGVMTPFRAQLNILKEHISSGVQVNTIDQYQGREKNCILFSCTKQDRDENDKGQYELLNDERRLTVALTRAKHKLVIVGDGDTLARYRTFKPFFAFLDVSNIVKLSEGTNGFSWTLFTA